MIETKMYNKDVHLRNKGKQCSQLGSKANRRACCWIYDFTKRSASHNVTYIRTCKLYGWRLHATQFWSGMLRIHLFFVLTTYIHACKVHSTPYINTQICLSLTNELISLIEGLICSHVFVYELVSLFQAFLFKSFTSNINPYKL